MKYDALMHGLACEYRGWFPGYKVLQGNGSAQLTIQPVSSTLGAFLTQCDSLSLCFDFQNVLSDTIMLLCRVRVCMNGTLKQFFTEIENPDKHLVSVNRSSPYPVREMLASLTENQPVSIEDVVDSGRDEDVIALVEDGDVVAESPVEELMQQVLLVNSDLYKTGAVGVGEVELPAVLEGLDEVPFRVQGYPESNKEKLLLISISRVIERVAVETGGGVLRASFQRLSRINDERGTRQAYKTVARSGVDVHVYGQGSEGVVSDLSVTVHTGDSFHYRRSWFVVFTPPDGGDGDHVALVALENESNVWDGFWTFRPALVRDIQGFIENNI